MDTQGEGEDNELTVERFRRLQQIRVTRFLLVGLGNTAVNFLVLNFLFFGLHIAKIPASILATSCAILFSFTWNRRYVFNDDRHPIKLLPQFIIVSSLGTLVIQSSAYALCSMAFERAALQLSNLLVINLSNLIASFVVMFWNYNGYRLFVFNRKDLHAVQQASQEAPTPEA